MEKHLTLKINSKALSSFILMVCIHLALMFSPLWTTTPSKESRLSSKPLTIIPSDFPQIRTLGIKNGAKDNNIFITPKVSTPDSPKPQNPFQQNALQNPWKKISKTVKPVNKNDSRVSSRPGSRPLPSSNKALKRFHSPDKSLSETVQETAASFVGSVASSPTLSRSDVNVHVELPEGVNLDQLNEFELMFYSFQKRMMEKYIESIILTVRDFEKRYPRRALFPEGKHVMTGRVTFDSEGNIQQIKMIRWTNAHELQSLFEQSLKSMNSLPNPPKMLWEKSGEFTVFYNFIVNNI